MARRSKILTQTNTTTQARQARVVSKDQIPDKMYFRIGEVAEILAVKSHVLRYWEKEFSLLKPQKSRAGQRMYRRRDVEILLHIRSLLYDFGYTIAGASKMLKGGLTNLPPLGPPQAAEHNVEALSSSSASIPSTTNSDSSSSALGLQQAEKAGAQVVANPSLTHKSDASNQTFAAIQPSAEQLALSLQKDPMVSRKKDIVRALKGLIAFCDHTDAQDIDPFSQLRQDRQQDSEERVVVATSRRHS